FFLARKIKEINPDSVLCFFPKPVIYGTLAAMIAGVKKRYALLEGLGFCFTQNKDKDSFKKIVLRKIQGFLYKMTLPFATKVLFLNNDDYHDLVVKNNIKIKDYKVIGGIGVNLNEFSYHPPICGEIHFGMVARLLREKGVCEFVEAAKIIKKKYPMVRFSIAGDFDDNPGGIDAAQIVNWKAEGYVEFLGPCSYIKEYLSDISVFVLPSYREGVPKSTQEAMAIGRAIITTDVPGCRETVIDGYNGYLVPPWDTQKLALVMETFIHERELIVTMGLNSRRFALSKFNESESANSLVNIITA
ncbi:glycosyltransferase family 4 protein, partial [Escherichia coli]|nr:glycosyltransferase family 4 protein [Escherichia coli]EER7389854.1 glycosyltransferase family 4 protein [Escherichia coli]EES3445819.1 glycosyltransferase family 4 protein [Escherichia coli]EES8116064.1 glycosyltransferase family 4 protein [Escherichia coli]EET0136689.1 glycosyltransferase family 4 protein [Escherichia coli]